jgi:hypothetical protein
VPPHVALQLVFGISRAAEEQFAPVLERSDHGVHECIIDGVLRAVFVIRLVMTSLCMDMRESRLHAVGFPEVENLRLMTVDEDHYVIKLAHGGSPSLA